MALDIFRAKVAGRKLETWEVYVYVRDGDFPETNIHKAAQIVTTGDDEPCAYSVGDIGKVSRIPPGLDVVFTIYGNAWAWARQLTREDGTEGRLCVSEMTARAKVA